MHSDSMMIVYSFK